MAPGGGGDGRQARCITGKAETLWQRQYAQTKDAGSTDGSMWQMRLRSCRVLGDPQAPSVGHPWEGASPSALEEEGASTRISMETRTERQGRL